MFKQLSMQEIRNLPLNGYNVVSLFSGCGGSSLGYKLAGYNILCAVDFVAKAKETYSLNFPNTPVIFKDVRILTGREILDLIGLRIGELDILDGSPPCSAFSLNGKREKNWGKIVPYSSTQQRVDDLFDEYARLVSELYPKVFVAENVKGLTQGKAKVYLDYIVKKLTNLGYEVNYRVLNAKDYGVPQSRERVILIGVRKDLVDTYGVHPSFPAPLGYEISTREAIEDLISNGTDQEEHSQRDFLIKNYFHAGTSSKEFDQIVNENGFKNLFKVNYMRDRWDSPYYTIKQHHTRPYHPQVDRLMSIAEAKRLQSFPDDFKLPHSPSQNWERIGRAVPPNLMKEVSRNILMNILEKMHG